MAQTVFKSPGCSDVSSANFQAVTLVNNVKDPTLDEVVRFSVAKSGAVYFAERVGNIKVVKADGSIAKVGKVDVFSPFSTMNKPLTTYYNNRNNEFGLVGFTLDPDFDVNHYIFVYYQARTTDVGNLSRFTVTSDVLDMASEKVIMSWPIQKNYCCHTGGDIRIDSKHDLWISVGNNTMNRADDGDPLAYVDESIAGSDADDQGHAANSNDYRGKILRIHLADDGTYTVPAGNFKDYYASMYTPADLLKIKPEIFAMGMRNPYTLAIDEPTGRVMWGEVGPDNGWDTEELNILDKPAFTGWPYFAGETGNAHYIYKMNKDPANPMNTSPNNTGVQKLPPAKGATIAYEQSCAITGSMYRWSAAQTSPKKLPGHFEGKWFITDWKGDETIKVVTLDNTGIKVAAKEDFLPVTFTKFQHPLQISVGPDGILYALDFSSGSGYHFGTNGVTTPVNGSDPQTKIMRIEYTGAPCAIAVSVHDRMVRETQAAKASLINLGFSGSRIVSMPFQARGVRLYDLQGKLAWEYSAAAPAASAAAVKLGVPASVGNGIYRAKYIY
ncbi:MAG: PQQ-dependent sugar dehydrogenase [Fibrobacteria bacterium]